MNELKCKCLTASSGLRCNNKAKAGGYCGKHKKCKTNWNSHQLMKNPVHNSNRCICTNATTGNQCINKTLHDSFYCGVHKKCKTTFKLKEAHRESPKAERKAIMTSPPRAQKAESYKDNQINYSPSVFATQVNKYVPRQKQVEDIMFNPSLLAKNAPKTAREQSPWLMKVKSPKAAQEDVMYSPHLDNLFLQKTAREQSPWLMPVKSPKVAQEDVMYSPHLDNLFLQKTAREKSPWLMKVKSPKVAQEDVMYSPHLDNLFLQKTARRESPWLMPVKSPKGHSSDLFVSPLKKRSPSQKQSHKISYKNLLGPSPRRS
jgi:hypothetical protein